MVEVGMVGEKVVDDDRKVMVGEEIVGAKEEFIYF